MEETFFCPTPGFLVPDRKNLPDDPGRPSRYGLPPESPTTERLSPAHRKRSTFNMFRGRILGRNQDKSSSLLFTVTVTALP